MKEHIERLKELTKREHIDRVFHLTMDEIADRIEERKDTRKACFSFGELTCNHIDQLKQLGFCVDIVYLYPGDVLIYVTW